MLQIDRQDRELLSGEIGRLAGSLAAGSSQRQAYAQLQVALEGGELADEHLPTLQQVLEILLSSGRVRRLGGPEDEQRLLQLYRSTPAGVRAAEHVRQMNRALASLTGRQLRRISCSQGLPGRHRLEIDTEDLHIALSVGPDGIGVHQLEVGG